MTAKQHCAYALKSSYKKAANVIKHLREKNQINDKNKEITS